MQTKIIAEIASCHNGDLDLAKALIKAASENGADICKFQDYRASNVPDSDLDKTRYEMYQFPDEWYSILIPFCKEQGVEFLTTCFNADRAMFLASQGLKKIKIASISMANKELLLACGVAFEELIVSTAFHAREEVEETIDWLATNAHKFTIMACTANYPLDPKDANLERINELKKIVEGQEYASVGYSDHSLDLDVAKCAIAMGVKYVEKHFSLSRHLPQIPHQMFENQEPITTHSVSIEPHELLELSKWRDKVDTIKGNGDFLNNEIELKIRDKYLNRYGK